MQDPNDYEATFRDISDDAAAEVCANASPVHQWMVGRAGNIMTDEDGIPNGTERGMILLVENCDGALATYMPLNVFRWFTAECMYRIALYDGEIEESEESHQAFIAAHSVDPLDFPTAATDPGAPSSPESIPPKGDEVPLGDGE